MKNRLLGKNLEELEAVALDAGLKKFAGRQLAQWLYEKRTGNFAAMTNLSAAARQTLAERWDTGLQPYEQVAQSADGTRKYLFAVECAHGGKTERSLIEAVMIPDGDRRTLCVSSQAGCKMGCKFCMTGRQGFHGNLDAADILNQILSIDEAAELTNIVFMGMGEPLDNYEQLSRALTVLTAPWGFAWSPKRITVSTIGVLPALRRYLDEFSCHLAVSLHNPFPDAREAMMPVQKAWPAEEVLALIRNYDFSGQRRVSFEYTMFAGYNDTPAHADALARLLRGIECRVNLIRFHRIPDFPLQSSSQQRMEAFRDRLGHGGITCTIRASRGEDISAACGMLAGKKREEGGKKTADDEAQALSHFQAQCARREYCSKDLLRKITERLGGDTEAAQRILEALKKDNYLSDARYAAAFAREKAALTGWGPMKIRLALRAKGVDEEDIFEALKSIDAQAADAKLEKLLAAKRRQLEGDPAARLKLIRYALSRGYSYAEIEHLIP